MTRRFVALILTVLTSLPVSMLALLASFLPGLAASAHAEPSLVYPGMPISQGGLSCTLGFVDPQRRVGITAGHCFRGAGDVHDETGAVIGQKVLVHDNRPPEGPVYDDEHTIDYEAIKFGDSTELNDILANGQRLERDDSVVPDIGMQVCHTGITTGDACGSITRLGNGWFRFDGPVIAKGDSGGPVYTRVNDRTVMLGIIRGTMYSPSANDMQSWAMSWRSVVTQLEQDQAGLLPA